MLYIRYLSQERVGDGVSGFSCLREVMQRLVEVEGHSATPGEVKLPQADLDIPLHYLISEYRVRNSLTGAGLEPATFGKYHSTCFTN